MSDPTCADLVKASGNVIGGYEARCFKEPMGCIADDRIDCENGCMLKIAYRAGKVESDAEIAYLTTQLSEARARVDLIWENVNALGGYAAKDDERGQGFCEAIGKALDEIEKLRGGSQ